MYLSGHDGIGVQVAGVFAVVVVVVLVVIDGFLKEGTRRERAKERDGVLLQLPPSSSLPESAGCRRRAAMVKDAEGC